MNLSSKTAFLSYLARLNPKLWEMLHPHVPKVSIGTRDVMAAMIVKGISSEIKDARIAKELQGAGKRLFTAGVKTMSYDDDDWCPTRPPRRVGPDPIPWTFMIGGFDEVMLNPQPLPPEQAYYGALLTVLADAVSIKEVSASLRKAGQGLLDVRGATSGKNR